ncbi:MAG: ribbon-helix-helix protein, CopG family [Candidatus Binatia bacterium]
MARTVVSLDSKDKEWLERKAQEEHVSIAQLIRQAVRHYREECQTDVPSIDQVLRETAGLWKAGDGLLYQRRIREEWQEGC